MSERIRIRLDLPRQDFALSVDLELPAAGISVFFGPSGSGKTTLLRCVAGLETAARGRVRIGEQVWQDDAAGVRLAVWRRALGYVFQEASLFEHLDVRGNLEYGLRRVGRARTAPDRTPGSTLDTAVALLGIAPLMNRAVAQLSGGERQRVAIARALATEPRLLLLDEPMASLDFARRQEIMPWLEKLRDELSIPMLYVTHSADEVARLADHLVVLEAGHVRAAGPVAEVLSAIETPVVLGEDEGTVVKATIAERDTRWHLLRAAFPGGDFWIRDDGQAIGKAVRLRVLARDVSIQLHEPHLTSIQNHLPCVIDSIADDADPAQALVRLRCGDAVLLARVTRRAVHALGLAPHRQAWAQIKAVALAS